MNRLLFGFFFSFLILGTTPARSQTDAQTFRDFQFSFNRVSQAWARTNDSLRNLFRAKGISYPATVYLREFKAQNELELWARNASDTGAYTLIKEYRVCALSGSMGPKRAEGDRQVPEGYYFIDDFNPKSDFHLSMLLNYPNYSDLILGNKATPGGDIYIHGSCVTVGCIPLTDAIIQELYSVCLAAKIGGQSYIPVHIYPTRFNKVGLDYLGKNFGSDEDKQKFWVNLKTGYDYFEEHRQLKPVLYTIDGRYVF